MGQPPQYMGQPPPYPLCLPAAPVEAHQGVRTIYVKGFPLDTQERELYNAVATQNGFEVSDPNSWPTIGAALLRGVTTSLEVNLLSEMRKTEA